MAAPDTTLRNVLLGAAIGFAGALVTQVFQRWLQRRALRRSLIKAVKSDMLYTVSTLEELAAQAKDPTGFQMQRLAMLDGFTDHYFEYRRDLSLFHERVRTRLHLLFTQIHAWREVQRLIEHRQDLLKAGHGKGVPKDEIDSMLGMAAPLHKLAEHALEGVLEEYDKVYRLFRPESDKQTGPAGYPEKTL